MKSINLLKQRIEVLLQELERLKEIEPELSSDVMFIENDIANILGEIAEHRNSINLLIKNR